MGSRLFWGLMIRSNVGTAYIFIVYRFLQKGRDSQKQVAAMTGVFRQNAIDTRRTILRRPTEPLTIYEREVA